MKIRYSGLIENDFINGEGVCVTLFTQGCPHHCPGCHNQETWDFRGGIEEDYDIILNKIIRAISKNGIMRNLSISGGEPLCEQNIDWVNTLIIDIKKKYPTIKIYCWTGYEYSALSELQKYVVKNIDILITGPYKQDQRDITLKLRGSSNQEIWNIDKNEKILYN